MMPRKGVFSVFFVPSFVMSGHAVERLCLELQLCDDLPRPRIDEADKRRRAVLVRCQHNATGRGRRRRNRSAPCRPSKWSDMRSACQFDHLDRAVAVSDPEFVCANHLECVWPRDVVVQPVADHNVAYKQAQNLRDHLVCGDVDKVDAFRAAVAQIIESLGDIDVGTVVMKPPSVVLLGTGITAVSVVRTVGSVSAVALATATRIATAEAPLSFTSTTRSRLRSAGRQAASAGHSPRTH